MISDRGPVGSKGHVCTYKNLLEAPGSRAVVKQKHTETRSKCQFEASWSPAGHFEGCSTDSCTVRVRLDHLHPSAGTPGDRIGPVGIVLDTRREAAGGLSEGT